MRSLFTTASFVVLVLGGLPRPGHAQRLPPISADRPGFGDGTATVAPGRLQVEAGYAFAKQQAVEQHELGQVLLRVGLSPEFEARFALGSYVVQPRPSEQEGTGDFGVGLKANLLDRADLGLAALATTSLPRPDAPFGSDVWAQEFKLAADWGLTPRAALSANVGVGITRDEGENEQAFLLALSLSTTLPDTEIGAYAGYARFAPEEGDAEDWIEAGLTRLVGRSTQLDVNGAVRLSDPDGRYFVGVGVARRF